MGLSYTFDLEQEYRNPIAKGTMEGIVTLQDICTATGGKRLFGSENPIVQHLGIDSRSILYSAATLFFALSGKHHNGHDYLKELYEKGIRLFVVEQENVPLLPGMQVILVESSVRALQAAAALKRAQLTCSVVGITGSNAKTIIKEYLYQMLSRYKLVIKSPKSYNSQVGVPLSVWPSAEYYELAIFEAGISQPGEMSHLASVIKPTIGLFTNIGPAHDEGFISRKQKVEEKLQLFAHAEKVVFCADHAEVAKGMAECTFPFERVSWSRQFGAVYTIPNIIRQGNKRRVYMSGRGRQAVFDLPNCEDATLENLLHCLVLGLELGFEPEQLQEGLVRLGTIPGRLELKAAIQGGVLIDDTYNNDPAGLQAALEFMKQHNSMPYTCVILSDMEQTGLAEEVLYTRVAELVNAHALSVFIGVGEAIQRHLHLFAAKSILHFQSTEALEKALPEMEWVRACTLVKGARRFAFERITGRLEEKQHGTVLEVNLGAIAHNLNYYRSTLRPGVKLMAMVKALAYGSGSAEVAAVLQHHRADYLAVAYPDEGVVLRKHGIRLPIMVTSPSPRSFETLFAYHLEPEIYSLDILQEWLVFLEGKSVAAPGIHLKLDTGMHRLGFDTPEILQHALNCILHAKKEVKVISVFSHLAASEDPHHTAFTLAQIAAFEHLSLQVSQVVGYMPLRHIVNSAGISRYPQAQYDMVRLGLGLYGVSNIEEENRVLKPVGRLQTVVLQIKDIKKGETIGYGRLGVAPKPMKIATLAIGYADGFPRALGLGKGHVYFKGSPAPTVGNVCMDMTMVDVTDLAVEVGDTAVIFDEEHSVRSLAAQLQTIPYEVLTQIHERVKRVFYTE